MTLQFTNMEYSGNDTKTVHRVIMKANSGLWSAIQDVAFSNDMDMEAAE